MFTKNHLFSNTLHTIQKNSVLTANRLFPSCPKPLPQSEAKYEAVDKPIFTRKVLHLASFSKWEFLELEKGLLANLQRRRSWVFVTRVLLALEERMTPQRNFQKFFWWFSGQRGTEKKERKFMYPSKQNYDDSRSKVIY